VRRIFSSYLFAMKKRFVVRSVEEYEESASFIVDLMEQHSVFLFIGELGAGKTTLVQKICDQIGTEDVVSSPTFALINPYKTKKGMIYHMDMYRVKNEEEAIDFGVEEYLWDGHFCFVEWPERIERILPDDFVKISITQLDDLSREINISVI